MGGETCRERGHSRGHAHPLLTLTPAAAHAHAHAQVGMFGVTALLLVIGEKPAAAVLNWFGPCLNWVAKWLPLFYVASLVTLPVSLSGIAGGGCV